MTTYGGVQGRKKTKNGESVILFGIKLDEDGKLKVSQKQVKRVIKEMRSGLCSSMLRHGLRRNLHKILLWS